MKKFVNKITKNKALLAFLLCGLLGILIVLPNIIINDGIYSLVKDLNLQQIPFNKIINHSIKNGEIFWTWYNDLGSNFLPTFSFYNMFSPFNLITYIFPESWFEYLIGPVFILKYAFTGLTSYLFLKRYVKNKNYAVLGSLLYTFSGYQLTNILFYHFHDVVCFFPLLLYTFDNLIYDNKRGRFVFVVALCAFTNWFFFIAECIFLVIYFIVKVLTKEYKITLKKFMYLVLESILGVTLAGVVLLPTVLFTTGNGRLDNGWNILNMLIYKPLNRYPEIIKSFIFPNEIMSKRAVLTSYNYRSIELYLPVVGSVLAISYLFKNKKSWISKLIIVLIIFMFIPILNSTFTLFQTYYYARWFFMPTLILTLMSIKCLEEKISIKKGIFTTLIFALIYLILITLKIGKIVYQPAYFILMLSFMFINLFILYTINKKEDKIKLLMIFIFIFITIWGNINVFYYKGKHIKTSKTYNNFLKADELIEIPQNSRANSTDTCDHNFGYILKTNNIRSFNSNINSSTFEFFESIGLDRKVKTEVPVENKTLNDILGVKYIISCKNKDVSKYGYKLINKDDIYGLYENPDYKEFGYNVNSYINEEEFNKLSNEEKIRTLNNNVVLTNIEIEKYKNLFENDVEYTLNKFKFDKNGFTSNITSTGETLAIYQIPYDKGFTAKINGKPVDIEKVNNGFMAIKINKGTNFIEFTYMTPGLKVGLLISLISLLVTIIYTYKVFKKMEEI